MIAALLLRHSFREKKTSHWKKHDFLKMESANSKSGNSPISGGKYLRLSIRTDVRDWV